MSSVCTTHATLVANFLNGQRAVGVRCTMSNEQCAAWGVRKYAVPQPFASGRRHFLPTGLRRRNGAGCAMYAHEMKHQNIYHPFLNSITPYTQINAYIFSTFFTHTKL